MVVTGCDDKDVKMWERIGWGSRKLPEYTEPPLMVELGRRIFQKKIYPFNFSTTRIQKEEVLGTRINLCS